MPNDGHVRRIAEELKIPVARARATAELLEGGGTVPFIARYRKEATGSLDEVAITAIRDRLNGLVELDRRRATILSTLDEQGNLTDDLRRRIDAAETAAELEDIYLPYKPKRRTRATLAREKGLEPLAGRVFAQDSDDPADEAERFVDAEQGVETADAALAGARDIVAEWVSEDAEARNKIRELYQREGKLRSTVMKGKENEGSKFKDYFDYEEAIARAPSHRVLAIRRGEAEGVLLMRIVAPDDRGRAILEKRFLKRRDGSGREVAAAIADGLKRLLGPSIETETRLALKKRADAEAIQVFADNVRQLLLAPPLGEKTVMAVDPAFRTGCKIACLDRQGKLLHDDVIHPHTARGKEEREGAKVRELVHRFGVEAIAIGNGTASRETEAFIRRVGVSVPAIVVDESGASIYSASEVARREFPEKDTTVRGAVSIGRRLMDPLAELVKIDPKSIGVGQYQHDVDQRALKASLDDVVTSAVNAVGVEVNTASQELLQYVSGLTPTLAGNLVAHREAQGPLKTRADLKKVPRLGPKAFEQAAGFLRIRDGAHPLDASAVHPERYGLVERMAKNLGCSVRDLVRDAQVRERIDLDRYVDEQVGRPTLEDILAELAKPGRDPRERFEPVQFREDIHDIGDLEAGMVLPGVVTNVTNFGAFVDLGVHNDGLVHISQMADRFVKDPKDVVKVHQRVSVTVLDVDRDRGRIALSMKSGERASEGGKKTPRKKERPADLKGGI